MFQWLKVLVRRIHGLVTRRQLDEEFQHELDAHLDMLTEENMSRGMPPEEARRAARLRLGGMTQLHEIHRELWGLPWIETLFQGLRYSLRQLRRNPGFTAVAVITLALGIGANTAIFGVVDGVLLKPLPYPHADRLVDVRTTAPGLNLVGTLGIDPPLYFTYRRYSRTFADIGIYQRGGRHYSANVTGSGPPERLVALGVTDGLLPALGVPPLFGRWFTPADDRPGSPDTVILTYGYWRREFGGSPLIVGKTLDVNGKPHTIIGVLPQRFQFLDEDNLSLLLPIKLNRESAYLNEFDYGCIARLKPGVTLAAANADAGRMIPIALRSFPTLPGFSLDLIKKARLGPDVRPLKRAVVGNVSLVLWVVMGGIGLVLLIACANVANLLLVRLEGRRQELAIRASLGASPGRIARSLWLESVVLSLMSGMLGLAFADASMHILIAIAPRNLPRLSAIAVNGPVLLFTLGIAVAASLMFSIIPTVEYAGVRARIGFREAGRCLSASRNRHRARNTLVVIQVGLALVLLISSGLMIRTFRALVRVQPGFKSPATVQTFQTFIPYYAVVAPERVVGMERAIVEKIEALPGVSSVGIGQPIPMNGKHWEDPLYVKDRTPQGQQPPLRSVCLVSPGFFKTIGTPIIAGREITWDDILNKRPVAMISENLARQYWPNPTDALGKQIRVSPKDDWRRTVGVVGNVHEDGSNKKAPATVYWPLLNARFAGQAVTVGRNPEYVVRSPIAGSQGLTREIQRAVWSVDPNLPLADVHTLAYFYRRSMARTSFTLVLLVIAGSMGLFLGIIGLYGVIAYSVSQRTHEIGIRMALGAQKRDVLRLVFAGGMSLTVIGVGIGIAAALALTRFLSSLLYGVKPTDPETFIAVSLILAGVALVACYIPARRATKIDPIVALRYE
jgi:predicted permease